ncbi:MAG: tRNA pseudouridine(38-40) synthase TruA [Chloroflexi bacterium]|nr:tRNA pseudouridine(38-40) synthase TruA [Chloroflexota bacterium]
MNDPEAEEESSQATGLERYKFTVSYDGTLYRGSQRQATQKTVQLELENALREIGWQGTAVLSAGRTDSGVHAEGQVFSADISWNHGLERLQAALNAHLSPEIAVREVQMVHPKFHPRYDARSRRYRYRIFFDEVRDPLRERFAWRIGLGYSFEMLQRAAETVIGEHDFSAFGSPPRKGGATVRTVYCSEWIKSSSDEIEYLVEANGFLYHMVRRLVYLQMTLAQGKILWQDWIGAVTTGKIDTSGLAPASGLTLMRVNYPDMPERL